ncbi:MAG: hypothetical protein DWQ21_02990 [Bacteroidetes bacterium]|nr:MAG: hypothetical protein DWQ21_02990 [Bacteroidota bacterium]
MQKNQAMVSRADDRPDDMLAVSRMFNPATPVKKYSPIKMLKDLSGDGKVTQKDVLIGRGVINKKGEPLNRKNKFCGGMSKPYSRKK